jgi:hypothetical protein
VNREEYIDFRNISPKSFPQRFKVTEDYNDVIEFNKENFDSCTLSQKAYNFYYNITENPKCLICSNDVSFGGNFRFGYAIYCGRACTGKSNKGSIANIGHSSNNTVSSEEILNIKYEKIYNIKIEIQEVLKLFDFSNIKYSLYKRNPKLLRAIYELSSAPSFSEKLYQILNDIKERPICNVCQIKKLNFNSFTSGYNEYCSRRCSSVISNNNTQVKKLEKYKNAIIYDEQTTRCKIKDLDKEGKITRNNITQSLLKEDPNLLKSLKNNLKYLDGKTLKEKLFHVLNDLVEIPKCTKCGKENNQRVHTVETGYRLDICIQCSNSEGAIKSEIKYKKPRRTKLFDNYVSLLEKDFDILTDKNEFIENNILKLKHKSCGKVHERSLAYLNGCPYCAKQGTSKWEKEIRDFIESLGVETVNNKRPLKDISQPGNKGNKEIDIQIPSHNLGIECNGIYHHTEDTGGKHRKFHLEKTEMAKEQLGMNLIHILDSEWIFKQEIVKSILLNKLNKTPNRIYARKCEIREVPVTDKNKFLDENHLQGRDRSNVKLGMYYENKLVSIMTFGKRKITGKASFEMIRFCNLINTNVIGAASKLFKNFLNNYHTGEEIITYADKRFSTGELYYKLGFEFSHSSSPNYYYTKDFSNLEHRAGYMKHNLSHKLEFFDSSLTEWENMKLNGYDRIWDCGNMVFKFNKRTTE